MLAVGSPNYRAKKATLENAGAVYIYDLNNGYANLVFDSFVSRIESSEKKARFGKKVQWFNDDLIVGAPSYMNHTNMKAFSSE